MECRAKCKAPRGLRTILSLAGPGPVRDERRDGVRGRDAGKEGKEDSARSRYDPAGRGPISDSLAR